MANTEKKLLSSRNDGPKFSLNISPENNNIYRMSINRGSYMSAHVLLNLSNELG